jgi:hypothetical protein
MFCLILRWIFFSDARVRERERERERSCVSYHHEGVAFPKCSTHMIPEDPIEREERVDVESQAE